MPGRIRPDDLDTEDYYIHRDNGRRHRSQPPNKNRVKEEDRPQRPKYAKDDSYYNPRDKYYISDDDEPAFHPYFAKQREDPPPKRRQESPLRRRHESPARYASPTRYDSPPRRRQASPSQDRRHKESQRSVRSRSSEDGRRQRYGDEEHDRRSRHSGAGSAVGSSRHRSSTTVPPPKSDHGYNQDHRPSRRETSHYPPSSHKSRGPKRSSTLPASSHRARASSRSSSPPKSPKTNHDVFMGAARAALQAGAMAAVKLQDDPSPWIGKKGTKVLTTALGAAMVDTFIEQRKPEIKGGVRHGLAKQVATFALGNLVTKPAAKHGLGGHHVKKGMRRES